MAKSRSRGRSEAAREKLRDLVFDMEEPLRHAEAFLRAIELMGAGMRGRNGEGDAEAFEVAAMAALNCLDAVKTRWDGVFQAVVRKG